MNHGLNDSCLKIIRKIFMENSQNINSVAVFGSRATGSYRTNSDIDLVIYGKISEQENVRIYTCFLESMLPYKVDITTYDHINYAPLKRHIDQFAKPLFTRQDLTQKEDEKMSDDTPEKMRPESMDVVAEKA